MVDKEEREATQFAMELLMPVEFVKQWLATHKAGDICDDKWVKEMAKDFKVPPPIMAIRLGELKGEGLL